MAKVLVARILALPFLSSSIIVISGIIACPAWTCRCCSAWWRPASSAYIWRNARLLNPRCARVSARHMSGVVWTEVTCSPVSGCYEHDQNYKIAIMVRITIMSSTIIIILFIIIPSITGTSPSSPPSPERSYCMEHP